MIVQPAIGIKGFFRVRCIRPDGRVRLDTGFFPNLILTSGRNYMATDDFMTSCQVGTDNTAPNVNQTALLGYTAGSTNIVEDLAGNQVSTTPYYGWRRKTWRFAAGTVAANLTEVGVGWGTSGSTLLSRAFILDPDTQNPTTITPLADELLEVLYELRYYPPETDVTSPSIVLDGVTYDTVTRAAEVNSQYWTDGIGNQIEASSATWWLAYDGSIGTVLQNPSGSGSAINNGSTSTAGYVNNSYEVAVQGNILSGDWNVVGGIRSVRIRTTAGSFQTEFTANPGGATIPKTSSYTMFMEWMLNWVAI